jgi:hypothetical protein
LHILFKAKIKRVSVLKFQSALTRDQKNNTSAKKSIHGMFLN